MSRNPAVNRLRIRNDTNRAGGVMKANLCVLLLCLLVSACAPIPHYFTADLTGAEVVVFPPGTRLGEALYVPLRGIALACAQADAHVNTQAGMTSFSVIHRFAGAPGVVVARVPSDAQ